LKKKRKEYVLVVRRKPNFKVYLRRYPRDLKEYKETGDFSYIHPNKLKTWVRFGEAAIRARNKSLEEVVREVMLSMSGVRFKDGRPKPVLTEEEAMMLRIEAMSRGFPPNIIDRIAVVLKKEKPKKERAEEVLERFGV